MTIIKPLLFILLFITPVWAYAQAKVAMLISGYGNQNEGKVSYDLEELAQSYLVLTKNGVEVDIISPAGGAVPVHNKKDDLAYIQEFKHKTPALKQLQQTLSTKQASQNTYDGLMIIGGDGAMFDLPFDLDTQNLITQFVHTNKTITAVCHGPAALINIKGVDGEYFLTGKTVNSFTEIEEHAFSSELIDQFPFMLQAKLEARGAKFVSNSPMLPFIAQDDKLITAQNPMSVAKAAEAMLLSLGITPKARAHFKDEATMELVSKAKNSGPFLIDLALAQSPEQYDINYLGLYGFYAYRLADTAEKKRQELQIMEVVGKHFSHPKYSEALIRAFVEQKQFHKAKQEKARFFKQFPNSKLAEEFQSI